MDVGQVRVRLQALQHCQRCLRGEGCGAGVFSRLFAPRSSEVWLSSEGAWLPGQRLRIGLAEPELMRLAVLLYGLPLMFFILAAALAATFVSGPGMRDFAALASGLLAGAIAFWLTGKLGGPSLNPRIESLSGSPADRENSFPT